MTKIEVEEEAKKLHDAVDKALGPKQCKYVTPEGTPGCVAAQYATMCDVTIDEMRSWASAGTGQNLIISSVIDLKSEGAHKIPHHVNNSQILSEIQYIWDTHECSEDEAKQKMHEVVNMWKTRSLMKAE